MAIDKEFYQAILKESLGNETKITEIQPTSGGCINNSVRLVTNQGSYFLKWNDTIPDDMFQKEMKGLQLLRDTHEIQIPEVIAHGKLVDRNYILLEYIDAAPKALDYWSHFGRALASLHKNHRSDRYGLDHHNYIGKLPQPNTRNLNWVDFFIDQRLEFQLTLALRNQLVDSSFAKRYRAFYKLLPTLLPAEPPSLLHGDLWSGNVMPGMDGKVCLIDPAVYYGHREIELAFTQMFGGFGPDFYDAYNEVYPLEPGYDKRVAIYNIYPSMVHVNLFGISYLSGVNRVLQNYL